MDTTEFAAMFAEAGHWRHYHLGEVWRAAGEGLTPLYPQAARRAYAWSDYYYGLYNEAWNANMPCSRFDSDGGNELMAVNALQSKLPTGSTDPPLPHWADRLIAGSYSEAQPIPDPIPPPFTVLVPVLDLCKFILKT